MAEYGADTLEGLHLVSKKLPPINVTYTKYYVST